MKWILLVVAIAGEVTGTFEIGRSEGFVKDTLRSIGIVAVCYSISLACLSLIMRMKLMELSVVYAVWMALGVAIVTLLSAIWLREAMTPQKIFFLALIVVGTVGLNMLEGSK